MRYTMTEHSFLALSAILELSSSICQEMADGSEAARGYDIAALVVGKDMRR